MFGKKKNEETEPIYDNSDIGKIEKQQQQIPKKQPIGSMRTYYYLVERFG